MDITLTEDWGSARLRLEISNSIFPGTRRVCDQLEQVYAELGEEPESGVLDGCGSPGT